MVAPEFYLFNLKNLNTIYRKKSSKEQKEAMFQSFSNTTYDQEF